MAQYRLPFSFNVVAKVPQGQTRPNVAGGKRNRRQMEQLDEVPPAVNQRNVRARFDGPSRRDPGNEQIVQDIILDGALQRGPGSKQTDHPMQDVTPRDAPQGGQDREKSLSASPPAMPPPQLPRNAGFASTPLSTWKSPQQAPEPPRTDGEPTPTLTEVSPESGSVLCHFQCAQPALPLYLVLEQTQRVR